MSTQSVHDFDQLYRYNPELKSSLYHATIIECTPYNDTKRVRVRVRIFRL